MGVYDFFKGKCPQCGSQIDHSPEYGACGDIQTKYFGPWPEDGECFRNFYPGSRVPFAPGEDFLIGRTCCCKTLIKACFEDDLLTHYEVADGAEKYDYIKSEIRMGEFWASLVSKEDKDWVASYEQTLTPDDSSSS